MFLLLLFFWGRTRRSRKIRKKSPNPRLNFWERALARCWAPFGLSLSTSWTCADLVSLSLSWLGRELLLLSLSALTAIVGVVHLTNTDLQIYSAFFSFRPAFCDVFCQIFFIRQKMQTIELFFLIFVLCWRIKMHFKNYNYYKQTTRQNEANKTSVAPLLFSLTLSRKKKMKRTNYHIWLRNKIE